MSLIPVFLCPVLLGFLTLSFLLRGVPLRYRFLFYLGASFPTGAGLCSLILFASYALFADAGKWSSVTFSVLAVLFLAGYRLFLFRQGFRGAFLHELGFADGKKFLSGISISSGLAFLLFAVSLVTVIQFYTLSSPMDVFIYGGGDARFVWTLKAKFFFRDPEHWRNMFSAKIFWSNIDYPLLLPGVIAFGWSWLGQESLLWAPLIYVSFYLSCVLILVWYLSARISTAAGWIGGTFFLTLVPYIQTAVRQLGDVPVTFFMTACGLTLAAAFRSNLRRLFPVAGLLGGLAAWTKNDGLAFIGWIYLLLGVMALSDYLKNSKTSFIPLFLFTAGALIPLLIVAVAKFYPEVHGATLGSGSILQRYFQNDQIFSPTGWSKTFTILRAFGAEMLRFESWKGVWGFFVLAALLTGIRRKGPSDGFCGLLFGVVVLMNAGYILIYHITQYNLLWHLSVTIDRLILHSGLLAIAFSFEALGTLPPKSSSGASGQK